MGRIKTQKVKRITQEILEEYRDQFGEDFQENKEVLNTLIDVPSKKMRNVIAGYITRLVQKEEKFKIH